MEISKTDLYRIIQYLDDAALIYEALAGLPVQRAVCRAHMIKQLTSKLKTKLPHKNG